MRRIILVVLILIIWPFLVYGGEFDVQGKAGDYTIEAKVDQNPPTKGKNNLTIVIRDKSSRPVTKARVQVHYFMPSLRGQPSMMEYTATAKRAGDHYLAQIDLSMAGKWTAEVIVTLKKEMRVQFTFMVE